MADNDFIIKKGLVLRNLEGNNGRFIRLDPNGKIELSTISETTVEDISANYSPITYVDTLTSDLQDQIDDQTILINDNADEISTLQTSVDDISGSITIINLDIDDINTQLDGISATSWAIDQSIQSDISVIETNISDISAAASAQFHNELLELQGGISGSPGEYYHLSESQFNDFIGKTEVVNISGDLQQQIDELESISNPISGSFGDVFPFTQADLSSGILDLEHNIDEQFVQVQIYDQNDNIITPDNVEAIDRNNVRITLDSFSPITGTWQAVVHASRFILDPSYIEEFKYAESVTTITSTQTTDIDYGIFVIEASGSDITLTIPDADSTNQNQTVRIIVAENPNAKNIVINTSTSQDIGGTTQQLVVKENTGFAVLSYNNEWNIIQDSRKVNKFVFQSPELDSPNNSDWAVNSLAPATADSINPAVIVRTFDDTTEEGVGFNFTLPDTPSFLRINLISKAGSAQTGNIVPKLYLRTMSDNAQISSWDSGTTLTAIAMTSNQNWHYDEETFSTTSLGITGSGEQVFAELTRDAGNASDTLTGDWVLFQVKIEVA